MTEKRDSAMYLLEAILVITLSAYVLTGCTAVTVYVGGNGVNFSDCGFKERPCQSIGYIVNDLHRASPVITIKVLSDIVETSVVNITRSVLITIEGVEGRQPVLRHLWNEMLFVESNKNLQVKLSVLNMVIIMREMNSFYKTALRISGFEFTMSGVIFKRTNGLGNGKEDENGLFDVYSRRPTISMNNCSFINFKSSTADRQSLSLLYVGQQYSSSSVTITNTSFLNNSFTEGMVAVDDPYSSSANLHVSGCVFDNNRGTLVSLKGITRVKIKLEKSNITNNEVKGENKGLVMVRSSDEYSKWASVELVNVTADNNKGTVLYTSTVGKTKVCVLSCTFSKNKTPFRGAALAVHSSEGSRSSTRLEIHSSTFFNNIATTGGAISSNAYIVITQSKFYENKAKTGGAISSNYYTVITKSKFYKNKATIGGAIYLQIRRSNISVSFCNFTHNTAIQRGGAIVTSDNSIHAQLVVESSTFNTNNAATGGAISSNVHSLIRHSQFFLNEATIGGAMILWVKKDTILRTATRHLDYDNIKISELTNSTIITSTNGLDTSTNLDVKNLSIIILSQNRYLTSSTLFKHYSTSHFLQLAGKVTFECGLNQKMSSKMLKARYGGPPQSNEPAGKVSNFFSQLLVSCTSCSKGTYNLENPTWRVSSSGNATEPISGNRKLESSSNRCHPCPLGGNCTDGPLKSRPAYWGYKKKYKHEIEFKKCPQNYCSRNSTSYNTCSPNRQGTLCSDCATNTSLGIFVSDCIDIERCKYELFNFILGSFPCILALFVVCMIFRDTLKNLYDRLEMRLESFKRVAKQHCCKYRENESEKEKPKLQIPDDNVGDDGNGSSISSVILRIAAFYQVQALLYIPSQLLREKVGSKLWGHVEHVLGMLSMMNFEGGGYSDNTTAYCFPPGFTFIYRTVLNIVINVCPIFLSLIILAVIYCFERIQHRDNPLKLQIQAAMIYFISWFYIPIIKNLFQLITCVTIVKDDVQIPVLYGQASQHCYNWWQLGIILLISLYLAWYFLFVYVGVRYLERKMYKHFFVMVCIPVTSAYYFWKLRNDENSGTKSSLALPEGTSQKDSSVTEENIELEGPMSEEAQHHASNEDEHVSPMDPQQANDPTASHCEKLVRIIRDPCKYTYWPSVVFAQKFCVGFMPVVFRNDYSQTLSLMVVLFIYFTLLVFRRPYTDRVLNILEPTLISFLLLLGVFGIINTAYQSTMDNNIQNVLIIVDYLKFVVLLCPLPVWIFLIVFNKLSKPDTKDGKHYATFQTPQTTTTQRAASPQTIETLETQQYIDSHATKSQDYVASQPIESQQDSLFQPTESQVNADFQPIDGLSDPKTTSFNECSGVATDSERSKSELDLSTKEPSRQMDVVNSHTVDI